jgi:hypothetical protein
VAPVSVPHALVHPVEPVIDQVTPVGLAPANKTNVAPVPTMVFPGTIVTKALGNVWLVHPVANVSPNDNAMRAYAITLRHIACELLVLPIFVSTVINLQKH